jgi:hypothetical protein
LYTLFVSTTAGLKKSLSNYEIKQYKPQFAEECSRLKDQRKQAKLKWLQNPNQVNAVIQTMLKHETIRYFKNEIISERQN